MISLIIPSYNPGSSLHASWQAIRDFVYDQDEAWEVLFVCDGSNDGSPELLQQWCHDELHPWCRVLSYSPNLGKGVAVRLGLEQARGSIRVFTDVDLAYRFDDLLKVVKAVQQGAPVAIANRNHALSRLKASYSLLGFVERRRLQSELFQLIAQQLLGLRHSDTQAGLKGFSSQAVDQIMPLLGCRGFSFDCEILLACQWLKIPVEEIPVTVEYQSTTSTTSWMHAIQMLRQIWQIRQRWKHGLPEPVPFPLAVSEPLSISDSVVTPSALSAAC